MKEKIYLGLGYDDRAIIASKDRQTVFDKMKRLASFDIVRDEKFIEAYCNSRIQESELQ
jgi:hypothetical protein